MNTIRIESSSITGQENQENLSPPLQALSEFYSAFNNQDLERMARNWLQSDEAIMDNPLGGIVRGWEEIKLVYDRVFSGTAHVYVEFYDYSLHEWGDVFYAVGRERF